RCSSSGCSDANLLSCHCAGRHSRCHLGVRVNGKRGRFAADRDLGGLRKAHARDRHRRADLSASRTEPADRWQNQERSIAHHRTRKGRNGYPSGQCAGWYGRRHICVRDVIETSGDAIEQHSSSTDEPLPEQLDCVPNFPAPVHHLYERSKSRVEAVEVAAAKRVPAGTSVKLSICVLQKRNHGRETVGTTALRAETVKDSKLSRRRDLVDCAVIRCSAIQSSAVEVSVATQD